MSVAAGVAALAARVAVEVKALRARLLVVPPTTSSGGRALVLADAGTAIEVDSSSTTPITIPAGSAVPFPAGTAIEIVQVGAGQVTVTAAAGVVLRTPSSLTTYGQWSVISLRKRAGEEWLVSGDLAASTATPPTSTPPDSGSSSAGFGASPFGTGPFGG